MFAAARVMAAGKAGLESLPYFVEELLAQGITQLAPWAADHNLEQRTELLNDPRVASWRKPERGVFEIGNGDFAFPIESNSQASKSLLQNINPLAKDDEELADNPAQLAAWCRRGIGGVCEDTRNLWNRYKYEKGIHDDRKLAVVIPYCPEGPTSGTVGMYLGAALRKHFSDMGQGGELVVWGIEICPPLPTGGDEIVVRSKFRGYVARQELLGGLPLSETPGDSLLHQPFDITIAFDGGTTAGPSLTGKDANSRLEAVLKALDRAAAQTTACLLNGIAGGDVAESTNWLKKGKRWNALLVHVVSERSYEPACRYLSNYQAKLPWNRNPGEWAKATLEGQKQAFLQRADNDIRPALEKEKDADIKKNVGELLKWADNLKQARWWDQGVIGKLSGGHEKVKEYLKNAIRDDAAIYAQLCKSKPAEATMTPRSDPFCINIALPEHLRKESAERMRDSNDPVPIADVLGNGGTVNVRLQIQRILEKVLERSDCRPVETDSQAFFEQIIAVSIGDWQKIGKNKDFHPEPDTLKFFVGAKERQTDGYFNPLKPYDLDRYIVSAETNKPKCLYWHLDGVDEEVPVEYSCLVLARCRPQDGFQDVSTYDQLKQVHDNITSNGKRWEAFGCYYGVKPPEELLSISDAAQSSSPVDPSNQNEVQTRQTNGHRTAEPIGVEQNA